MMVRRNPDQYNFNKLQFDERLLTKHFTSEPRKDVRYVVVHHMVILDRDPNKPDALDVVYNVWQSRPASAHYGVDGKFIAQFVLDKDYAWATGNTNGNLYGISIEHANSSMDGYTVAPETWKNGAKLAAYIHKVYNLGRPVSGKTLRKHSEFSSTACPGPYLGGVIWNRYVKEAQSVYDEITGSKAPSTSSGSSTPKPSAPSKPKGTSAPPFPLPKGHYFGPKSGPNSSVSGFYSHRDDLRRWQRQMLQRGWMGLGQADGLYGPRTATVAKQFQREKGLAVDGLIGIDTWNKAWTADVT